MWRIHNNRKRWRRRWPWRWLFPLPVNERYCRECGLAYHDGPLPKEVARYDEDSVSGLVFPAGGYRRGEFKIRFGRWMGRGDDLFLGDFIPEAELDALLKVATQAWDAYCLRNAGRHGRR